MIGLTTLRSRLDRIGDTDIRIALWTALVVCLGNIFVYSSSALMAQRSELYGYASDYFVKKQIAATIVGVLACLFIATCLSWKHIERFSGIVLAGSIVSLVLVFVPGIGMPAAHVNRWISIAGFSFQPAEPAKLALVLYLAKFIADRESRWIGSHAVVKILLLSSIVSFLIYKEPDFSTAVFVMLLTMLMLFMGGLSWTYIGSTAGVAVCIAAIGLASKSYVLSRIQSYLKPWNDPGSHGFQILQSYIALGRGGTTGVGLGNSIQKTALLPAPHTDFIYAVIGEETGFVGTVCVAALFLAFFVYGLRMAYRMPNLFLKLATAGIVYAISLQALINMAVVTGLMPVTGEPLPLISVGGTSMVITLMSIGCLMAFSRELPQTAVEKGAG